MWTSLNLFRYELSVGERWGWSWSSRLTTLEKTCGVEFFFLTDGLKSGLLSSWFDIFSDLNFLRLRPNLDDSRSSSLNELSVPITYPLPLGSGLGEWLADLSWPEPINPIDSWHNSIKFSYRFYLDLPRS